MRWMLVHGVPENCLSGNEATTVTLGRSAKIVLPCALASRLPSLKGTYLRDERNRLEACLRRPSQGDEIMRSLLLIIVLIALMAACRPEARRASSVTSLERTGQPTSVPEPGLLTLLGLGGAGLGAARWFSRRR